MGRTLSYFLRPMAYFATEVLNPFVIVAGILAWVAWLTDPLWVRTSLLAVFFISAVPLVTSRLMAHKGVVTDKYIRHRTQRTFFYAVSLGSIVVGAALVFLLDASSEARWMVAFAVGTLLGVMVINKKLKISIHALISALAMVIFPAGCLHPIVIGSSILVWALVSWSRVYLSRHSTTEVISGTAFGSVVGFAFLLAVGGLPSP